LPRGTLVVLWASLLLACPSARIVADHPVPESLAMPRIGPSFSGALTRIDEGWTLTFDVAGESRRMPVGKLVWWGSLTDPHEKTLVLLEPEGWLPGRLVGVNDQHVTLKTELFQTAVLPRQFVRGMLFPIPGEWLDRDKLAFRLRAHRGTQDRLWLANGDELSVRTLPSPGEGEESGLFGLEVLNFQRAGVQDSLAVATNRVLAIAFAQRDGTAAGRDETFVTMGFRNGACLAVRGLSESAGRIRLSLGKEAWLDVDAATIWPEITLLLPAGNEVSFLSDLEPSDHAEVPFLDLSWRYGRDRNALGGRLRCGGRLYLKGLGMHGTSRLVYDLRGGYQTFAAELALDDLALRRGSVTYRVFLERDGKWAPVFESPIIRGTQRPTPARLDISDASRIALVVDHADYGDVLDCANWLYARLLK